MGTQRFKIVIFYRILHDCENAPTLEERYTTTFIIDERYVLGFIGNLIREDIARVEVFEYNG